MKRPIQLALAVPAAVIVLLAIAEGVARLVWREPVPAWRLHALLGFVRAANFTAKKIAIDTGEPFTYEVNALGLRSRTLGTIEKKPGVYRIVFLGGSTTENGDLPHEHTFPGIVEAKLQGRGIEVANAGVPGATTNVVLAQLVHRVLPLRPDLVVCLDPVLNDLTESLRIGWDPTMGHLAADPPTPRFMDWLSAQSRLLGVFNTRTTEPSNARELFGRVAEKRRTTPTRDPDEETLLRGLSHFEGVQRVFLEVCRDEKVACVLVTEPILLKPHLSPQEEAVVTSTFITGTDDGSGKGSLNLRPETLVRALDAYNATTRTNAKALGAIVVDGANAVPKDLDHFFDDVHLSTKGNEKIAAAVLEAIAPLVSR